MKYHQPDGSFGARNPGTRWTPEMDVRVIELVANRLSAYEIAGFINREFDTRYSRNAVIGRVHRRSLGTLNGAQLGRPTSGEKKPRRARRISTRALSFNDEGIKRTAPQPIPTIPDDQSIPIEQRCTFMQLDDHLAPEPKTCRYPVGDVGDPNFFFCGAEPIDGKPYCVGHHKIAHAISIRPNKQYYYQRPEAA